MPVAVAHASRGAPGRAVKPAAPPPASGARAARAARRAAAARAPAAGGRSPGGRRAPGAGRAPGPAAGPAAARARWAGPAGRPRRSPGRVAPQPGAGGSAAIAAGWPLRPVAGARYWPGRPGGWAPVIGGAGQMILGIDHVQITVPAGAVAAARAFYRGRLGLREVEKSPTLRGRGGFWLQVG